MSGRWSVLLSTSALKGTLERHVLKTREQSGREQLGRGDKNIGTVSGAGGQKTEPVRPEKRRL